MCDKLHALRGKSVATHGYHVAFGFHSNTCSGSGYPPYELSSGLIQQSADYAQAQAFKLRALAEEIMADGYKGYWFRDRYAKGVRWKYQPDAVAVVDLEKAKAENRRYVTHLRTAAVEAGVYAEWQRDRLKTWKYNADGLVPVKAGA